MEAIILAGGLGTRLREVLPDLPKPMAPINGEPFLSHLLNLLKGAGVTRAILAVGHRSESIRTHFGENHHGLPLRYSMEENPLGTGGAVRKALTMVDTWPVIALNGDTLFPIPISEFMGFHMQSHASISLALRFEEDCGRYGRVNLESGGRVSRFEEKQYSEGPGFINGGIYLLSESAKEAFPPNPCSLENEIFPSLASQGLLFGKHFDSPFLDIGIPSDYARSESFLNSISKPSDR